MTQRSYQRPCGAATQKPRSSAHPAAAGRAGRVARAGLPAGDCRAGLRFRASQIIFGRVHGRQGSRYFLQHVWSRLSHGGGGGCWGEGSFWRGGRALQVAELTPDAMLEKSGAKAARAAFAQVPVATMDTLTEPQAIIFGTPTRFGNMAAQMRNFLDQTRAF